VPAYIPGNTKRVKEKQEDKIWKQSVFSYYNWERITAC